jgi:hypothetical protein
VLSRLAASVDLAVEIRYISSPTRPGVSESGSDREDRQP